METRCEIREIWCGHDEKQIYGLAFIPPSEGRLPLVVFGHELGRNHQSGVPYAERLAEAGYAAYVFDYCGASVGCENRSSGSNLDMSVVTEQKDMEAVLAAAGSWEFVDPARIAILGASQGGIAGMLAAARQPDAVAGLVMMYPPLSIPYGARNHFGSLDAVPEEFDMFDGWIRVGRCYAADMWEMDFDKTLAAYPGRILLLHGDRDRTAKLRWSQHAAEVIPDCEFHIIPGAGHHFSGQAFEEAMAYILHYLATQFRNTAKEETED